ncbi:hypothetical protein G6F31_015618 [Rhizopus arrhizus]|nr:hypothetical protein G6F31_015618 [Rhizopus arrhizus]
MKYSARWRRSSAGISSTAGLGTDSMTVPRRFFLEKPSTRPPPALAAAANWTSLSVTTLPVSPRETRRSFRSTSRCPGRLAGAPCTTWMRVLQSSGEGAAAAPSTAWVRSASVARAASCTGTAAGSSADAGGVSIRPNAMAAGRQFRRSATVELLGETR